MKSTMSAIVGLLIATALPVLSAAGSGNLSRRDAYVPGERMYESSAVIQIFVPRRDVAPEPDMDGNANNMRIREAVQSFLADQKKAIVEDENVRPAVRGLMPHFEGDHQAAIQFMRAELEVEQIRGTDLLKIIVRSADRRFSRDLANRLTEEYLKVCHGKEGVQDPILHKMAEEGGPVAEENKAVEQAGAQNP